MTNTTRTDEEYQVLRQALLEIAHGTWFLHGFRHKRFSREDCVDRARRAALQLGLDWSKEKPERHLHAARLSLLPVKRTPEPVIPPDPLGKPPKKDGMALFADAGKGAL
jgi:hypothetical protein